MLETIFFVLILGIVLYYFLKMRKQVEHFRQLVFDHVHANGDMRKTLAMGLYYRFKPDNAKLLERDAAEHDEESLMISDAFELQTPAEFEHFVADVVSRVYGGAAYVTSYSGEGGVHIEHDREDGRYLGQVNCEKLDLSYDPIAIMHSQVIKQQASGGFVVTTSSFTEKAKAYADGLNIELIDGIKLVELWIDSLEQKKEAAKQLPRPIF